MKVLFSTIYKSDFVLKSIKKIDPNELVLLVDKKIKDEQVKSLKEIEKICDLLKIKLVQFELELFNPIEIVKDLNKIFSKYTEDDLYIDLSSSRRNQIITVIDYFSISRCENLKDLFLYYYNESEELIYSKINLFHAEELSNKEVLLLDCIYEEPNMIQREISECIESTESYTSKLIDKLLKGNYLEKNEKKFNLTEKGIIYLESFMKK